MKKLLLLSASVCSFAFISPALAEHHEKSTEQAAAVDTKAEHYTFDKAHTQVLFFVNHLGFSMSQGEFHDYDGYYTFDRAHPEKSTIDVTINTGSIDMDDEKWDDHLKNKDFFNVEKFPTMTFKSTAIEVTGENTADITGDLTILGVTKPAVLKTTYNKSAVHPFSKKYVSGFSATATVKRSEYGMTYGLPGVGDDVEVRIEVEGYRTETEDDKAAE